LYVKQKSGKIAFARSRRFAATHTISTDEVPEGIVTAIAVLTSHVTLARALTSDVTLDSDVIAETAQRVTVAR